MSPSATAITGYTPEEHYSDPELGFKLVHPDDRELLARAGTPDAPDPLVLRWLRRDGAVIWTEQHNVPILDDAGSLIAIEGTARDVTARELARAAVDMSERRFRSLLERVDLLAGSLDRDGKVTFTNAALARTTGWAVDEVDGADWFDTFVPAQARDGMRAAFQADVASANVNRDIVTQLLVRDGSVRRARLHVMGTHDAAGHLDGVAMVGVDLTAAEARASRTAHLTAAIEQTADSVIITDAEARILYVNPAFERTTGYTFAEVHGQNPRVLQSGRQSAAYYRRLWRTLASGTPWSGELINRRRDGSLFTEEATITPIRGADGSVSAYVGVKRDVTRVRELSRSLDAARAQQEAIAHAVAGLEAGPTLEVTADRVAAALLAIEGVAIGSVILFENHAQARVTAIASELDLPLLPGGVLPASRAEYLRERASQGPWVEAWRARMRDGQYGRAIAAAGIRSVLYVPIPNGSAPSGLLVLGSTRADATRTLARNIPSGLELASVARTLMGSELQARHRSDEAQVRIASVIEHAAFAPVYQPVIDLTTGAPAGFEALTRFADGTRPDVVFAEARSIGMGLELEAATLMAGLSGARGLPSGAWLSLNVSPALVVDGHRLAQLIANRTRPIVLEITEHEPIDDYATLRSAIAALGRDVRIAADDAGAGIANFAHLVELRPEFVKVDHHLVRGVNADVSRQAMVVALSHFARSSSSWIIAEGIETEAELTTLRELGLRYGQGYLLGRPAPAETWAATEGR